MLDAMAGYKCYSFMDGFLGYNQIQIYEPHRWYTSFTTDWGIFAYMVMPFGLCNAPATFQRVMIEAFQKYLREFMEIFLDDFIVFGDDNNHADYLQNCFDKCMEFGISINAAKSIILVPFGRLVGHIVSEQGIATDPDKIADIISLPIQTTVSEVKGFLGHTGYYRRFIYQYEIIAMPLFELLKKGDEIPIWTSACTHAFNTLKRKLMSASNLIPPNWEKNSYINICFKHGNWICPKSER
jgi:hypothetical protein